MMLQVNGCLATPVESLVRGSCCDVLVALGSSWFPIWGMHLWGASFIWSLVIKRGDLRRGCWLLVMSIFLGLSSVYAQLVSGNRYFWGNDYQTLLGHIGPVDVDSTM